jgi:HEPN domain-containing protein
LLEQAERDLAVAQHNASSGFHEWAAFDSQQSAEKAVKALIEHLNGSARGHSITELLLRLPASVQAPSLVLAAAGELDRVYITSRYPNGFAAGSPGRHFSEISSRRLIEHARVILEFCRSQISGS